MQSRPSFIVVGLFVLYCSRQICISKVDQKDVFQSPKHVFNKVGYCFISLPSRTFVDPHNPQYSPVVWILCSYCVYGLLSLVTNDAISHPARFPDISATLRCRIVIALCQVRLWAYFAHAQFITAVFGFAAFWRMRVFAHCVSGLSNTVMLLTSTACYKSVTVCVILAETGG